VAFKLPSITSAIPRDLRSFCDRVREALNAQGNDRIITRRDLIATGVVVVGPGNTLQPTDPTELAKVKYDTPPAPTGLATSGAIANIILTWDAPNYPGHSYTEVYVADTNTFTSRVKLADVPGSTYSHSVGASTTKYYWIRFVNVAEVPGPYNSTTGVSGTTGDDPDYLISVLSDAYGVTGDGLFFQINSPTVINGVTIPAGTYIKQAVIADATIARAKIQDLAVDNAKIADLSAVKITAGFLDAARIEAGTISASKLDFTVVGTTNVVGTINASSEGIRISGTRIQIDGNVTFSAGYDPTTKITSGGAATDINNNVTTISGGKITTGSIAADKINVTNLIVENLKTSASGQRVEITKANNDLRVYNASGTLIAQFGGTGFGAIAKITSVAASGPALWGENTGAAAIYGVNTGASPSMAIQGYASSSGYGVYGQSVSGESIRGLATAGGGNNHGVRGLNTNGNGAGSNTAGLVGAANGYDFYADGAGTNYGPFTGTHDALTDPNDSFIIGDIVVDSQLVRRNGISSAITLIKTSTSANQKAALGVICAEQHPFENNIPAVYMSGFDEETGLPVPTAEYEIDKQTYNLVAVNALGEGQINVCGEGGNIEAGDLIVTSSLPGKGMKQSDDIVRAVTVAKARESVTFASPTEVKQIACIYLCG
jgi:hypothetical protein